MFNRSPPRKRNKIYHRLNPTSDDRAPKVFTPTDPDVLLLFETKEFLENRFKISFSYEDKVLTRFITHPPQPQLTAAGIAAAASIVASSVASSVAQPQPQPTHSQSSHWVSYSNFSHKPSPLNSRMMQSRLPSSLFQIPQLDELYENLTGSSKSSVGGISVNGRVVTFSRVAGIFEFLLIDPSLQNEEYQCSDLLVPASPTFLAELESFISTIDPKDFTPDNFYCGRKFTVIRSHTNLTKRIMKDVNTCAAHFFW